MRERLVMIGVISVTIIFGLLFAWPYIQGDTTRMGREAGTAGVASSVKEIVLTHEYRQGVHFYVGVLDLPTPCHNLSSEALVRETYPEQVTLRIKTTVSSLECTASTTPRIFKIAFQASREAEVKATFNSLPVNMEVQEVSPGEHLSL